MAEYYSNLKSNLLLKFPNYSKFNKLYARPFPHLCKKNESSRQSETQGRCTAFSVEKSDKTFLRILERALSLLNSFLEWGITDEALLFPCISQQNVKFIHYDQAGLLGGSSSRYSSNGKTSHVSLPAFGAQHEGEFF